MPKNVLVALTTEPEEYAEKLRKLDLPDLEILIPQDPRNAKEMVSRANILIGQPPLAKLYINDAKNIVWMQSSFAGVDALTGKGMRQDYALTNIKGGYGELMAEYALAYMLLFEREILENLEYQKEKVWKERDAVWEKGHTGRIEGKTVTLLGTGAVGKEIARKMKALGLRTLGYQTTQQPVEFFDEVFSGDGLKECLAKADYVISVLPKTEATTNLMNYDRLSLMKPSGVFINIGRGNVVPEADLIRALNEKKIAKAVLDVFNEEPLPKDNPLWTTENLYITPHMAAYVVNDMVFQAFAENYERFRTGKGLLYQVDFERGY